MTLRKYIKYDADNSRPSKIYTSHDIFFISLQLRSNASNNRPNLVFSVSNIEIFHGLRYLSSLWIILFKRNWKVSLYTTRILLPLFLIVTLNFQPSFKFTMQAPFSYFRSVVSVRESSIFTYPKDSVNIKTSSFITISSFNCL